MKRVKYVIIIFCVLLFVFGFLGIFMDAKKKKEEEEQLEKDKVAEKYTYSVKRSNNKYRVKGEKLEGKTLEKVFYDSLNVYLYYTGSDVATLLKYNVENGNVVVLFEDSKEIFGGFSQISSKYFRLGNGVYNKRFKKVMDYPELGEGEILSPDLEKVYYAFDDGVSFRYLTAESENQMVIKNIEDTIYTPVRVTSDGNYLLLKKVENDKTSLVVLNSSLQEVGSLEMKGDDYTYTLLGEVPYVLEEVMKNDTVGYKIYDLSSKEELFRSKNKKLEHYLFSNTKFVANDREGNIFLMDYVTLEKKKLISKEENKKKRFVSDFLLAEDMFSLVLRLHDSNLEFFLFYL